MKIALIGYGKMGHAIEEIAIERGHSIVLKINEENAASFTADNLKKADLAIEFTNPAAAVANIQKCLEAGLPVVSGTTGWLRNWKTVTDTVEKQNGCFLYASNFSIGVNIFFEVNRFLAGLMSSYPDYDVELKEIHHTAKKDAPSGTAITLAEQVMESIHSKKQWVNAPSKNPEDLVIISERVDPAPGTHIVTYHSDIDDIEIKHTAHSRKGFALGAVLAAEYIAGKKGIFTMKDVLFRQASKK